MRNKKDSKTESIFLDIESVAEKPVEVLRREDIKALVEPPLQKACEILYDKNIKTVCSCASKKTPEKKEVFCAMELDSLSPENKTVALAVGKISKQKGKELVHISIPIDKNAPAKSIRAKSVELADKFEKQPLTWAPTYTLAEVRKMEESPHLSVEKLADIFEEMGGHYDAEAGLFYLSKEHYDKIKEFEKKQRAE